MWVDGCLRIMSTTEEKTFPPGDEKVAAVAESSRVCDAMCRSGVKAQREKDNRTEAAPIYPVFPIQLKEAKGQV